MDRLAMVPHNFLRHVAEALQLAALNIASLRTLCARRQTIYEQQHWTWQYVGMANLNKTTEAELRALQLLRGRE